jgi:hypothetical protein
MNLLLNESAIGTRSHILALILSRTALSAWLFVAFGTKIALYFGWCCGPCFTMRIGRVCVLGKCSSGKGFL